MARPSLGVGARGAVWTDPLVGGEWSARARYRDQNGRLCYVERIGGSKAEAVTSLTDHLQQRATEAERDG